jgi:hypothetical protein
VCWVRVSAALCASDSACDVRANLTMSCPRVEDVPMIDSSENSASFVLIRLCWRWRG